MRVALGTILSVSLASLSLVYSSLERNLLPGIFVPVRLKDLRHGLHEERQRHHHHHNNNHPHHLHQPRPNGGASATDAALAALAASPTGDVLSGGSSPHRGPGFRGQPGGGTGMQQEAAEVCTYVSAPRVWRLCSTGSRQGARGIRAGCVVPVAAGAVECQVLLSPSKPVRSRPGESMHRHA